MFRSGYKHLLEMNRVSQDEVHLICTECSYKRAIPLTIQGSFENKGIKVQEGDEKAEHVYRREVYT